MNTTTTKREKKNKWRCDDDDAPKNRDFFFGGDANVRDGERHTHATTRGGVCGAFANLLFLEDDDDAG